jgi:3-dehydroquinate synthase
VGSGAIDLLIDDLLREAPGSPLVLISDSHVAPLHGRPLAARLRREGLSVERLEFPAGEASKNRRTKGALEDALYQAGVGRDAAVVAVGGGVTGDLAGFLAATWHRGIPVIQVPTSLLAMVDAALGGKTGVNLRKAKNLLGCFHQPWGVYADVSTLATLPDRELREGLAEVVKSAVVGDLALFRWLESEGAAVVGRDAGALERTVLACTRFKQRVVQRDEREAGRRAALNFGHTVAHALELVSAYRIGHGSAVSLGLCVESRLAASTTGFPRSSVERIERLLDSLGLPIRIPSRYSTEAIVAATARDKKVRAGRVHYALPSRIGRIPAPPNTTREVDERLVDEALNETR